MAREELSFDPFESRAKRMHKSVLTASRLHVSETERKGFRKLKVAMLTCTYREDGMWSKNHIGMLRRCIREWLVRRRISVRFVWVMELTKRGRPHYHMLVWLPRGITLPKPDKQGWWPYGMTKIEWAKNAVGYIAKYASKTTGDDCLRIPRGARLHGAGGHNQESKRELRWWKTPLFARECFGVFADIFPIKGGRVNRVTGEFIASPWHVVLDRGGLIKIWREVAGEISCPVY